MESSGWKPNVEISPNCPRCGSCNTKFCYYNNYSLTQPRFFCKGCRRYWTKGGSLRNVPVGGGCRKNRRSHKSSFSSHSTPTHALPNSSTLPSNGNPSSSSSSLLHAPNIDLALVYANFLNPKQESTVPTTEVGPISDVSTLPQYDQVLHGKSQLMSEGDQMFSQGFNSVERNYQQDGIGRCSISHDIMNFELPPLPGEEVALHDDMMWSNSAPHATQSPLFGADHGAQDVDFLMDNWSHFDFPRP